MAKQVLLVDNSDFMRDLLRKILESEFEVVAEAANGVEAVELYKEHDPDLVLMDVELPIRDGIAATEDITEYDADASVIMCTRISREERMKEAVKAGADGYITKPFQKPSVMDEISDVLSA